MIRLNNNRQRRVKEAEARARRGRGQAKRKLMLKGLLNTNQPFAPMRCHMHTARLIVITQIASASI